MGKNWFLSGCSALLLLHWPLGSPALAFPPQTQKIEFQTAAKPFPILPVYYQRKADFTYLWVIGLGGALLIPEMLMRSNHNDSQYWSQAALMGFGPQILMLGGYLMIGIGFLMGFSQWLYPETHPGNIQAHQSLPPAFPGLPFLQYQSQF